MCDMAKISFFIKRLLRMDTKRFRETLGMIRAQTGRSTPYLLMDLLICGIRYNAGYMDYMIARMDRLSHAQRKTVITRGISNTIVRRMNDKDYWRNFDDKTLFNATFSRWVKRGWMRVDASTRVEDIAAFCAGKGALFAKPLEGSSGVGVERLEEDACQDAGALLSRLREKGDCILEEALVQHPDMAAIYPGSVNTIRIATLLGDKASGIVYAFMRIGNGRVMDNVDCGGMAARVDLETGIINTVAADKKGHEFARHPLTDVAITGFKVPFFEEAKKACLDAMQVVPQLRFVAWDVAITPDGPEFIEGNSFPSHAVPQFAAHYPDGIGIMPEFERFITL